MRLPLVAELDSRDGAANKDARMTNMLAENDNGVPLAVVRPGLEAVVTATGNGNGLTDFNAVLISVFGTTLGCGTGPVTVGTVTNAKFDFVQSSL